MSQKSGSKYNHVILVVFTSGGYRSIVLCFQAIIYQWIYDVKMTLDIVIIKY